MAKPKKTVGRPRVFNTPEDLESAINEFINNPPMETHRDRDGNEIDVPSITITGLCWELGFESRQSFYDYEKEDNGFSYIIKRARMFIENAYERKLHAAQCTGAIFALKNMGWTDKADDEVVQERSFNKIQVEVIGANVKD